MKRVYNFAAGPATMPPKVLETAANEMLCFGDSGMSVMEMTHRGKAYQDIFDETIHLIRNLMQIPDSYEILLLQGGATGQFAAIPLNLMTDYASADYIDSGNFAHGALVEAQKYGTVRVVASSREENYVRVRTHLAFFDPGRLLYITPTPFTAPYHILRIPVPFLVQMPQQHPLRSV